MSALLERQAKKWKAQSDRGELPQELYAALADGHSSGFERRIIRNLAKISRIINPDSTIRPYSLFSLDWKYKHSEYGVVNKCELCGHQPIVENCVLENQESGKRIYIGNTCVTRYVEVRDKNGNIMTAKEKTEYLKEQMTDAKIEYRRQDFTSRHPTAMKDLARYEPMMKERKALRTLHKKVVGRIVKHGYLGPKIDAEFSQFMLNAEKDYVAWREDNRRRLERAQADKAAVALRVAEMRNTWVKEADEWDAKVASLDNLNDWEQGMVQRVSRHIRNRGRASVRHGMARFVEELEVRFNLLAGESPELTHPTARFLFNNQRRFNAWEQSFSTSIITRLECGRSLSPAQTSTVEKLKKRYGFAKHDV